MSKAIICVNKYDRYLSKKHFCPECKTELNKVKVTKIVNSDSKEAKEMPKIFSKTIIGSRGFKFRNFNYIGDVKYVLTEFKCDNCHRHFSIEEMKEIEGVSSSNLQDFSQEEIKKINRKKLIFNKILPIVVVSLIAIMFHLIRNI